jgi:hypothetical protein
VKKQKNEHDHAAYTVKQSKAVGILSLPNEILACILKEVMKDGDRNFILSSVCKRFKDIMTRSSFRCSVLYTRLDSIYDWRESTEEFKQDHYNMYEIKKCFGCDKLYKEMCGFVGNGQLATFYKFYSSLTLPGFCSNECIPGHLLHENL